MRTTHRTIRQPQVTKVNPMSAVIELHVSELKINFVGEHCQHCAKQHAHLLQLIPSL